MRVEVELFPQRRTTTANLPAGSTGLDLVRSLGLSPDVHFLVKGEAPIPIDEVLEDGDRVRVIAVVSGG